MSHRINLMRDKAYVQKKDKETFARASAHNEKICQI